MYKIRSKNNPYSVLFFLLFGVLPLAAGLLYALAYSVGLTGALSHGFTLTYWQKAIDLPETWCSLGLSAFLAILTMGISTALALILVNFMAPALLKISARRILRFPLAIPPVVAAFLAFQVLGNSGMLARTAAAAGMIRDPGAFPPLINDPFYAGVVWTMVFLTFPFLLLLALDQYQRTRLESYAHLAATLGASKSYAGRRVIVPVLWRRLRPALLLYTIFLFGSYEVPLLLGRQSPAMISVLISRKFARFNLADVPVAYALTVIYALLILLAVLLFWNSDRRKMRETT